jgi:hypothetical protein
MSDIIAVIKSLEKVASLKGVSQETVVDAEKKLGLSFAADYKAYLIEYGLISAKHIEITGLTDSKRLNVVDVTLSERQSNKLPHDMYVVDNTGIEGILILQNGKGEIFEFINGKSRKIFDNLIEYLISL